MAVVVLAGGGSRRWGGRDKTAALLDGRPVLEHVVRRLVAGAGVGFSDVVVAGPRAEGLPPGVTWVREEPAGGGPVAGLAAAVAALAPGVDVVVLGAGDTPFAGEAVPGLLAALRDGLDGVIGVDASGCDQLLLGAHRVPALRDALAAVGEPAGARIRDLVAGLTLGRVRVSARAALDLDTPEDLDAAARLLDATRPLPATTPMTADDG